jgi:hypothetical protein
MLKDAAGGVRPRDNAAGAAVQFGGQKVRLLPDAHGLFDVGGLHGGMVLHDHVAIERQRLFHGAGKVGGRPVHLPLLIGRGGFGQEVGKSKLGHAQTLPLRCRAKAAV